MNRIRRLLKQLAPVQEMADKAFAEQEREYQADKKRADERREQLRHESEKRRREILERS